MISVRKCYILTAVITFFCISVSGQTAFSPQDKSVINSFEKRANDYIEQREVLRKRLPALPKKATAEQIEAHKTALLKSVQTARQGITQGSIFTPETARLFREIIRREFRGPERAELRKTVFEAENKAVAVRANYPYPESQENLEMPPALLLALPQLPKDVRYRFVGRNLLLVDRGSLLIVDYMPNAIP